MRMATVMFKLLPAGAVAASVAGSPAVAEVLPAIHSPQPFRQTAKDDCAQSPCTLKFDKVEDLRLLEIASVTCLKSQDPENTFKIFLLSKSPRYDKTSSIVAVAPAHWAMGADVATDVQGPFYFNAGETPYVNTLTMTPSLLICSLSGTLWRTD